MITIQVNKPWQKGLIWAVALILALSDGSAGASLPASQVNPSQGFPHSVSIPLHEISIPESFGTIETLLTNRAGSGQPFVFILRDAHAIVDAQNSIFELIRHLQENYGIKIIGLEGGAGKLDPTLLRAFPDAHVKRKILRQYLEKGELTGAEMAAVFNKEEAAYHGIDDWRLYELNYLAYLNAHEKRKEILENLEEVQISLDRERRQIYSKKLNQFHEKLEILKEKNVPVADLFEYLWGLRGITKRLQRYPELKKLFLSLKFERRLHGEKESIEMALRRLADELREKIGGTLNRTESMEFNEQHQAYVTGRLESAPFLRTLIKYAKTKHIQLNLNRTLTNILSWNQTLGSLHGSKVFDQLELLIEELEKALTSSPAEKQISEQYRSLKLLRDLANLELTRSQWEKYRRNPSSHLSLLGRIEEKRNAVRLFESPADFYRRAVQRDKAFSDNLRKILDKKKMNAAAIVVGGFHSAGLERKLKKEGVSYAVITPKIETLEGESDYHELMQGKLSYQAYLKTTFYDGFMRHAVTQLMNELNEPESRKNMKLWRDEILRKLAEEGRIAKAGSYTHYIDLLFANHYERFLDQGPDEKRAKEMIDGIRRELKAFKSETLRHLWGKFLSQLREFSRAVELYGQEGKLTAQNVSRLMDRVDHGRPTALQTIANTQLIPDTRVFSWWPKLVSKQTSSSTPSITAAKAGNNIFKDGIQVKYEPAPLLTGSRAELRASSSTADPRNQVQNGKQPLRPKAGQARWVWKPGDSLMAGDILIHRQHGLIQVISSTQPRRGKKNWIYDFEFISIEPRGSTFDEDEAKSFEAWESQGRPNREQPDRSGLSRLFVTRNPQALKNENAQNIYWWNPKFFSQQFIKDRTNTYFSSGFVPYLWAFWRFKEVLKQDTLLGKMYRDILDQMAPAPGVSLDDKVQALEDYLLSEGKQTFEDSDWRQMLHVSWLRDLLFTIYKRTGVDIIKKSVLESFQANTTPWDLISARTGKMVPYEVNYYWRTHLYETGLTSIGISNRDYQEYNRIPFVHTNYWVAGDHDNKLDGIDPDIRDNFVDSVIHKKSKDIAGYGTVMSPDQKLTFLIERLKKDRDSPIAGRLADGIVKLFTQQLNQLPWKEISLIVPTPSSKPKNQVNFLANALENHYYPDAGTQAGSAQSPKVSTNLLSIVTEPGSVPRRDQKEQNSDYDRLRNAPRIAAQNLSANSIASSDGYTVALFLDDVRTTGATGEAAIYALLEANPGEIDEVIFLAFGLGRKDGERLSARLEKGRPFQTRKISALAADLATYLLHDASTRVTTPGESEAPVILFLKDETAYVKAGAQEETAVPDGVVDSSGNFIPAQKRGKAFLNPDKNNIFDAIVVMPGVFSPGLSPGDLQETLAWLYANRAKKNVAAYPKNSALKVTSFKLNEESVTLQKDAALEGVVDNSLVNVLSGLFLDRIAEPGSEVNLIFIEPNSEAVRIQTITQLKEGEKIPEDRAASQSQALGKLVSDKTPAPSAQEPAPKHGITKPQERETKRHELREVFGKPLLMTGLSRTEMLEQAVNKSPLVFRAEWKQRARSEFRIYRDNLNGKLERIEAVISNSSNPDQILSMLFNDDFSAQLAQFLDFRSQDRIFNLITNLRINVISDLSAMTLSRAESRSSLDLSDIPMRELRIFRDWNVLNQAYQERYGKPLFPAGLATEVNAIVIPDLLLPSQSDPSGRQRAAEVLANAQERAGILFPLAPSERAQQAVQWIQEFPGLIPFAYGERKTIQESSLTKQGLTQPILIAEIGTPFQFSSNTQLKNRGVVVSSSLLRELLKAVSAGELELEDVIEMMKLLILGETFRGRLRQDDSLPFPEVTSEALRSTMIFLKSLLTTEAAKRAVAVAA